MIKTIEQGLTNYLSTFWQVGSFHFSNSKLFVSSCHLETKKFKSYLLLDLTNLFPNENINKEFEQFNFSKKSTHLTKAIEAVNDAISEFYLSYMLVEDLPAIHSFIDSLSSRDSVNLSFYILTNETFLLEIKHPSNKNSSTILFKKEFLNQPINEVRNHLEATYQTQVALHKLKVVHIHKASHSIGALNIDILNYFSMIDRLASHMIKENAFKFLFRDKIASISINLSKNDKVDVSKNYKITKNGLISFKIELYLPNDSKKLKENESVILNELKVIINELNLLFEIYRITKDFSFSNYTFPFSEFIAISPLKKIHKSKLELKTSYGSYNNYVSLFLSTTDSNEAAKALNGMLLYIKEILLFSALHSREYIKDKFLSFSDIASNTKNLSLTNGIEVNEKEFGLLSDLSEIKAWQNKKEEVKKEIRKHLRAYKKDKQSYIDKNKEFLLSLDSSNFYKKAYGSWITVDNYGIYHYYINNKKRLSFKPF